MRGGKKAAGRAIAWAAFFVVCIALFVVLTGSLGGVDEVSEDKGRELLEQSIRRAAVSCYASEGAYPPDVDYITEHCGVVVDESRYAVYYEIFADNIMPEITVVELG